MTNASTRGPQAKESPVVSRLDSSLASAACAVVASAHDLPRREPQRWLDEVVRLINAETPADTLVSLAIVEPVFATRSWHTHAYALAGGGAASTAAALRREAADGFPNDDLATHAGQRGEHAKASAAPRRVLMPDERWFASALAAFRRPLGLHELVRAFVPFQDVDAPKALMLQLDLTRLDGQPEEREITLVAALAPALTRAYMRRFVHIRRHRAEILARLTPAQRRIVEFLVEGHSETRIAAAISRSAHTIHDHTKTIYHTLGVSNRLQLRDVWFDHAVLAGRDPDADPGD